MRTKRFLAFLLVLLMVVSLFPAAALAEGSDDEPLVEDVPPAEVAPEAEAEAEANKKIAESLTDNLIQFTQINTWNGQLPTYVSGGAAEALPVLSLNAVQQPEAGSTAE